MSQRYFNHPEELTRLWPDMQLDEGIELRSGIQPWWRESGPKTSRAFNFGPGYGRLFLTRPRDQRVMTKAMPTVNRTPGSWYRHGLYLQREGASKEGEIGRGFDHAHDTVDLKTLLAQWQREHDPRFFKIILSPEHGDQLDLKDLTRQVMHAVERDLETPLQWAAIAHHNTGHAHVHVVLRGMAQGKALTIAKMYLQGGIKGRAQEVATRRIGPRSRQEIAQAAEQGVHRRGWSYLDQSLTAKMNTDRLVDAARLTPHEQGRLEELERRGLAWRERDGWRMSFQWEAKHMDERNRQRTPQEREQDINRPEEQKKEHMEREADKQHRRAVIVDELEQEVGWGR